VSRLTLSLVVIAKDEEPMLADCLRSVRGLADELLVVLDDRTQDRTAEIALTHGARLGSFTYDEQAGALAAARNTAAAHVTTSWALWLDADERLTPYGRYAVGMAMAAVEQGAAVDGFAFLLANRQLVDGETTSVGPSNVRLGRSDLRWSGSRIHSELRIDGDPHAGRWRLITGDTSIDHFGYGYSPDVMAAKVERNLRLLLMDVADNPRDGQAWSYLAELFGQLGRRREAATAARNALKTGMLRRREQILQMRQLARGRAA
jgi:glycosyltransferase involved in cell wall biosynthesis